MSSLAERAQKVADMQKFGKIEETTVEEVKIPVEVSEATNQENVEEITVPDMPKTITYETKDKPKYAREEVEPEPVAPKVVNFLDSIVTEQKSWKRNSPMATKFTSTFELDQGKEINIMQLKRSKVSPLEVPVINDTVGHLARILDYFSQTYEIVMVPCEAVNIPKDAVVKNYTTVEMGGRKYYQRDSELSDREAVMKEYVDTIYKELKDGKAVKRNLFKTFTHEDVDYLTLNFTQTELVDLVTLFDNFGPKVVSVGEDELWFTVGDYIYG